MTEIWRVIPSYPSYEVSNAGRVRRISPYRSTTVGRMLKPYRCPSGHLNVRLSISSRLIGTGVHRLVCEAFHGAAPTPAHVAAHFNGVADDNRPENVRWATPRQNFDDRYKHGTEPVGVKNGNARLSEEDVLLIRSHLMFGERPSVLARMWGIADAHITRIGQRKVWRHLEF